MKASSYDQIVEILYLAASCPVGLVVSSDGTPEQLRQALHRARRKIGDPTLDDLQFRNSPFEGDLIIVHQHVLVPRDFTSRQSQQGQG